MKNPSYSSIRLALLAGAAFMFAACENASITASAPAAPAAGSVAASQNIVLPVPSGANQPPVYPVELLKTEKPGAVYVDCVVDENGQVLLATVQNSTHRDFTKSTLDAIRGWTFKPGTRDGVPVAMRVIVPVEYTIKD